MAVISAHCRIVPFIIGILFAQEPIASQLYVEIKWQLDATDEFLLQILLRAQHVPGNIMPIIRSSRILYKWLLPVVFGAWFSSLRGMVWSWGLCVRYRRHVFTYLLTYSMDQSPFWELIGFLLVKKFPAFYETRRFITAFTSARHLSLSWARSLQSIPLHPTSWRSILILSPTPG